METKQKRQERARHEAAMLARIAMRLQRVPKDQIDKLLREADACLKRYKMARFVGDDKAVGTIDDEVAEGLEAPMQALAEVIRETIAPHAYCLLVFGPDDAGNPGAQMGYVSNANRDDLCQSMREFIVAHEAAKS